MTSEQETRATTTTQTHAFIWVKNLQIRECLTGPVWNGKCSAVLPFLFSAHNRYLLAQIWTYPFNVARTDEFIIMWSDRSNYTWIIFGCGCSIWMSKNDDIFWLQTIQGIHSNWWWASANSTIGQYYWTTNYCVHQAKNETHQNGARKSKREGEREERVSKRTQLKLSLHAS